jgi:hypothetical protein
MLQILGCGGIWFLVFSLVIWRLIRITQKAFSHLKRLHQIPCSSCAFFTGDYRLKCTVNPVTAMSEEAINCRDFMAKSYPQSHFNRKVYSSCYSNKNHNCDRRLGKDLTEQEKYPIFNSYQNENI